MKKGLTTLLSIAILLFLWQTTAMIVDQPEFFPSLSRLLVTLIDLFTHISFYLSIGTTLLRGIAGMAISFITALVFAGLFARMTWLYDLFRPLLTLMRSVPVISFILLALIFMHPESIPLLIGFLTMFPLLTENLTKGIRNLNPALTVMGRQFRLSRRNKLTQIVYPQLKPFLYSGLASAAGFGWRAIIMGEVLSQCTYGIGSEMKRAQTFIAVSELLTWTLIAIAIGFLSDKLIQWLSERRINIRFQPSKTNQSGRPQKEALPITVDNISYYFGISHFSYHFEAGRTYGISAPSGTGKTTLLNLINGTWFPVSGTITIDRSQGIGSLFQEPLLLPHLNITENVALSLSPFLPREDALAEATVLLHHMELEDHLQKHPDAISYGQQQRVAIARALAYPSPFLLMDEPFRGLDEALRTRIIAYIHQRQNEQPQTILFTSHQAEELSSLADTVIRLK